MEITINLKVSAEGIFAEILKAALKQAAAPEDRYAVDTAAETMKLAQKPAKEKPAPKAKAEVKKDAVTLTEIRQYAAASDERKKLLREILTGLELEEPKLQFLPEDKYETVFAQLKNADI